jgi:hypothetical protein
VKLIDEVAERLDQAGVPFALIGAGALAVHGISRATLDQDLLATDARVLRAPFWTALNASAAVDAQAGDADDPLAGMVRFTRPGDRIVDVVVGRPGWMDDVLHRRIVVPLPGRDLPVVSLPDLILLKLYAGGVQDRWDIAQVLEVADLAAVQPDVESRLSSLPAECGMAWQELLRAR